MTEDTDDDDRDGDASNGDGDPGTSTPIDGVLAGDEDRESDVEGAGLPGDGLGLGDDGAPGNGTSESGTAANGDPDAAGADDDRATEASGGDDATDEADDEVEPVELLVRLAEDGEIDPWDIDIVEVTDAFLAKLDETDLRTSGRALFYASVLLRMKSDELIAPDEAEEDAPEEPWLEGPDGAVGAPEGFDPVDALEAEMDRRLDRKHARGSPETLDELVRELREAERDSRWKSSRSYDTSSSPRGFQRGTQTVDYHAAGERREEGEPDEDDVTGTTHSEDIEVVIEEVRSALQRQYDKGRTEVLFAELHDAARTEVMTYLALLFLANRGSVELEQDDLFGDLWIQDPTAPAVTEEPEVVADGGGDAAGADDAE